MLPSLLNPDQKHKYPSVVDNKTELCADLGLDTVINEMAGNNPAIIRAAQNILFESPAANRDVILYRQQIIKDTLDNADKFMELYDTLSAGLAVYEDARRKCQPGYARFVTVASLIRSAAELLETLFALADKARRHFEIMKKSVTSEGIRNYIQSFATFYSEDFIGKSLEQNTTIKGINEGSRVTLGVRIGNGLKGTGYVVRKIDDMKKSERPSKNRNAGISLDSVSSQLKAVELRDAALSKISHMINSVITQTADDLKSLFYELSFYIGCINLYQKLASIGLPVCFPSPCTEEKDTLSFSGLVDVSLALNHNMRPVANTLDFDDMRLTLVTGANQGGKSTFLRSVGCAQIMAQCGMYVAANDFRFSVRPRVFTHFCKPEDASMDSGKLDEELARLDKMIGKLQPRALLLMNESFASTAEREGAALAREVNGAFYDLNIKVIFVTHLYEYAHWLETEVKPDILLLRAQRREDGRRTFIIRPGLSLPTSYGMDLFRELISFN